MSLLLVLTDHNVFLVFQIFRRHIVVSPPVDKHMPVQIDVFAAPVPVIMPHRKKKLPNYVVIFDRFESNIHDR